MYLVCYIGANGETRKEICANFATAQAVKGAHKGALIIAV